LGNDVHVQRLDALAERVIINRQRALQKRAAGERHQPEPIRLRLLHQIKRGEFGAGKAVRCDVLGQHGLRGVNGYDDIQALLFRFLPGETPLRSSERNDQQRERNCEQHEAHLLSGRRNTGDQAGQQPRLNELRHQPLPLAPRPPEKYHQRRQNDQQRPQDMSVGEVHRGIADCRLPIADWVCSFAS
jgi:hypothetical protein